MSTKHELVELTVGIVAAYVENHTIATSDVPALIATVHHALATLSEPPVVEVARPEPAVPLRRSVMPDYIICLEDGRKFKSLKRHLRTRYNMSPEDYRQKWNLPSDYPMVAPNYAKVRSDLARSMGLGQSRRTRGRSAKTG